jgi:hypothetical protein
VVKELNIFANFWYMKKSCKIFEHFCLFDRLRDCSQTEMKKLFFKNIKHKREKLILLIIRLNEIKELGIQILKIKVYYSK